MNRACKDTTMQERKQTETQSWNANNHTFKKDRKDSQR